MAVELKAIATLDGKQFQAEIQKISNSINNFGSRQLAQIKGMIAGAFSVGAIVQFGSRLLNLADTMEKTSRAFGVAMDSMVALKDVAGRSSVSYDSMMYALARVRDAQGEVVEGNKQLMEALDVLGISSEDFITSSPDKALELIAVGFRNAGESAQAYSALQDILGRQAGELVPALQRLAEEGLEKVKSSVKDATEGFKELADAKQYLEELENKIIIFTARAVKAFTALQETLADMFVEAFGVKIDEELERRALAKRFEREVKQGTFQQYWGEKKKKEASAIISEVRKQDVASLELEKHRAILQKKREEEQKKAFREYVSMMLKLEEMDERREARNKEQDEILLDYEKKRKDILEGKGIAKEGLNFRVDTLQQIGGIVGGVAGRGMQQAAIQERQAAVQEKLRDLQQETVQKLADIERKMESFRAQLDDMGIAL